MKEETKTKQQLLDELAVYRSRVDELEASEKKLKKKLSMEDQELHAIFQAAPIGFCYLDNKMRIIRINAFIEKRIGKPSKEVRGKYCYEVFGRYANDSDRTGKDKICDECQVILTLNDGKMHIHEREVRPDYIIRNTSVPIKDRDGNITGIIEMITDISEHKRAETALRESEIRLKTILDSVQTGIVVIDSETHTIVDANPTAIKWIGGTKDRIIGSVCHRFICPAEKGKCPITDLGQTIDSSERILLTTGKKNRSIMKTVVKVMLGGREHLIESFIDITDRRKLEDQLIKAQKMEAIGTLAGGIAHDFNNLLMGIQGYTWLMLQGMDPPHPHYQKLRSIEDQIRSGAELTKQLLGFARRGKYQVKPTDMNEVVEKTSAMFGRTKKEIAIHRTLQGDLRAVEVDQSQIEQALMNLYVNAWQAMPGGGELYLETRNVVLGEDEVKLFGGKPGNYVKISVTDTGVGMDEQTIARIFDPFFTTKEMGRGTGLGLASTYGIMRSHGGMIHVHSERGRGSAFEIYLPASEKKVPREKKPSEKILTGTETVLLVDDEEVIIDVSREILKTLGYKVLIAKSGQEAIDIYRTRKEEIDLILLDMIMPGMGGGETFDILKKIAPDVPVILSSGYSIDGQAAQIMKRGCRAFIQKPFGMVELSQKIKETLEMQ